MRTRKMIKTNCHRCNREFEKLLDNYNYGKKYRNNVHFCSKSCRSIYLQPKVIVKVKCDECKEEFDMTKWKYNYKHKENNGKHYCSLACFHKNKSQFAFGYFIDKGHSSKRWECDLDVEYLTELWIRQNGICPYTGIKMLLPKSKRQFTKLRSIEKASLDRIDTTKGYLKGNVEFVCQGINFAKHDYSKEDVLRFVEHIKNPS